MIASLYHRGSLALRLDRLTTTRVRRRRRWARGRLVVSRVSQHWRPRYHGDADGTASRPSMSPVRHRAGGMRRRQRSRAAHVFRQRARCRKRGSVRTQLDRFEAQHPGLRVELRVTPGRGGPAPSALRAVAQRPRRRPRRAAARHHLDGGVRGGRMDSAARCVRARRRRLLSRGASPRIAGAARCTPIPWFVDVGLLYWRTDLVDAPPRSLAELRAAARRA